MDRKLVQFIFTLLTFLLFSPSLALAQTPPQFEFLGKPLNNAYDSAVSGNLAFVAAQEHIYVVDISKPDFPVIRNFYEPGCIFYTIDVSGDSTFAGQAHFSCEPTGSIYVLDVSNLENFNNQNPLVIPTRAAFYEMTIQDEYLYIASGQEGLVIYNIQNPTSRLEPVATFKPEPNFRPVDVKVRGNVAYVADSNNKFSTVDITNKSIPRVMDSLDYPNGVTGVSIEGNLASVSLQAYLPSGNGGFQVVNIEDPNNISPVGEIIPLPTPEAAVDIEVSGNYAMIVDDRGKLFAVDISNPASPTFVADYQMEKEHNLTISGDLILASNLEFGLSVFRFSGLVPAAPTPFLDLPWDYESQGLSFGEAALEIQSYFDHEYPFEDVGSVLSEPPEAQGSVSSFRGDIRNPNLLYSNHDGYDWISKAGVHNGDLVLAAADGTATFLKADGNNPACGSWACGNVILVDHGNGYQTRYYHLQDGDPIMESFTTPKPVHKGDPIGKVGSTGNSDIPHIHFMVIRDKNRDGNFYDNRPDGVTDPFGWQTFKADPWPNYVFNYGGQSRNGIASYYLWTKRIPELRCIFPSNDPTCGLERFGIWFPETVEGELWIRYLPSVWVGDYLRSLGSSVELNFRDPLGNPVHTFQDPFTLNVNFESFDLSRFKLDTLSIYSSQDGVNWLREETSVDMQSMTASARLNHLSNFALMAERIDITPPSTEASLFGTQGEEQWFNSDVMVNLNAQDNEGGLGIYYIGYRVDQDYFREYTGPFTIAGEGKHTIEFYSVDNDGNIEEVKTIEFSIDKTPPLISLSVNPYILWPPNGKMVDVTILGDASDNIQLKSVAFRVEDEYNEIEPVITGFNEAVKLEASRRGNDLDGRTYKIWAKSTDLAGNDTEIYTLIIVPHDQSTN